MRSSLNLGPQEGRTDTRLYLLTLRGITKSPFANRCRQLQLRPFQTTFENQGGIGSRFGNTCRVGLRMGSTTVLYAVQHLGSTVRLASLGWESMARGARRDAASRTQEGVSLDDSQTQNWQNQNWIRPAAGTRCRSTSWLVHRSRSSGSGCHRWLAAQRQQLRN